MRGAIESYARKVDPEWAAKAEGPGQTDHAYGTFFERHWPEGWDGRPSDRTVAGYVKEEGPSIPKHPGFMRWLEVVCDRRYQWIIYGEEPRSRTGEAIDDRHREASQEILANLRRIPLLIDLREDVRGVFLALFPRWARVLASPPEDRDEDDLLRARLLVAILRAAKTIGLLPWLLPAAVGRLGPTEHRMASQYLLGQLASLSAIVPDEGGQPVTPPPLTDDELSVLADVLGTVEDLEEDRAAATDDLIRKAGDTFPQLREQRGLGFGLWSLELSESERAAARRVLRALQEESSLIAERTMQARRKLVEEEDLNEPWIDRLGGLDRKIAILSVRGEANAAIWEARRQDIGAMKGETDPSADDPLEADTTAKVDEEMGEAEAD